MNFVCSQKTDVIQSNMSFSSYKLPVAQRVLRNIPLSDHLRPQASFSHEKHKTYNSYKQNNWNNNTIPKTCGSTDYYSSYNTISHNNPYPSYPTHNKIRHCLNNTRYYPYLPSSSYLIPPPPPPPLMELLIPGLKHGPAPHKDNKHIKHIHMKTNIKTNPEIKRNLVNPQMSEITTSKIIEKKPSIYSPPILPIPTYYDVFKILEKRWEVYDKSRLRVKIRGEGDKVKSEDCIPKKITLVDYLSKKGKERVL